MLLENDHRAGRPELAAECPLIVPKVWRKLCAAADYVQSGLLFRVTGRYLLVLAVAGLRII